MLPPGRGVPRTAMPDLRPQPAPQGAPVRITTRVAGGRLTLRPHLETPSSAAQRMAAHVLCAALEPLALHAPGGEAGAPQVIESPVLRGFVDVVIDGAERDLRWIEAEYGRRGVLSAVQAALRLLSSLTGA